MLHSKRPSRVSVLKRLGDRALEASDLEGVAALLTRGLPEALGVHGATLLLWDRKLDTFEALSDGETRATPLRPGERPAVVPEARYLISEGQWIETAGGQGDGTLLPLMARGGLVGMLVLGPRRRRLREKLRPSEVRAVSQLATRAALALENHLYQRELIASERMAALGSMAGMLAHDFRGPMTVIRGYAETLFSEEHSPLEVKDRSRLIMEAVDRLERMTQETLDFARGGGRLVRRPVALPTVLEELAADVEAEVPGLEVVRSFHLPDLAASLDVDKLRRAVGNIAANARDAMKGRGRFHLEARVDAGHLVLVLVDEGPGVPPEIRGSLFEPFVTQGKKGGTGLGLAIAKRFVEDHGGTLELLPDGPGARFRLSLPLEVRIGT